MSSRSGSTKCYNRVGKYLRTLHHGIAIGEFYWRMEAFTGGPEDNRRYSSSTEDTRVHPSGTAVVSWFTMEVFFDNTIEVSGRSRHRGRFPDVHDRKTRRI